MKYSVNLRMRNELNAKFLIVSEDTNDFVGAFEIANSLLRKTVREPEHFVEIVDNDSGEVVASINGAP